MPRTDLNDITAFLAVAREGSFTKAAAKLGVGRGKTTTMQEKTGHSVTK